jgi:hypothetical protein
MIKHRLLHWAIFVVAVSLFPFGLVALSQWCGTGFDLLKLWPKGQLLLVSTAISADAVGELIGAGNEMRGIKLGAGGLCFLSMLFSACWYVMIQDHSDWPVRKICYGSIVFFAATVVSSFSCKALAMEVQRA